MRYLILQINSRKVESIGWRYLPLFLEGKKKLLTCSFSTTYMAMGSSPCSPDEMIVITGKNVAAPAIGSLGDCCGGPISGLAFHQAGGKRRRRHRHVQYKQPLSLF